MGLPEGAPCRGRRESWGRIPELISGTAGRCQDAPASRAPARDKLAGMSRENGFFEASAPTRIDLAGGTVDIWPLYLLTGGAVTVNAAITLRSTARAGPAEPGRLAARAEDLERTWTGLTTERPAALDPEGLPLHEAILRELDRGEGWQLTTRGGVPAGSGLGGSSSLAVAMLGAMMARRGEPIESEKLVAMARDIEARVLEIPTGTQDHLAAVHGGISAITYGVGAPVRRAIDVKASELEARGTLAYLGESRASARANWDMIRRVVDGDPAIKRALVGIASIGREMAEELARGDFDACGRLLAEEWDERRNLSPAVSTPQTDAAIRAAAAAGADGAKICGAGGGGCLFVLGPPDARERIASALEESGCRLLEFRVDPVGLVVREGRPE